MSQLKSPATLRGSLTHNRRTEASHTGLLAAAMIVAAGHAPAFAQSTAAPASPPVTPSTAAPASPTVAPSGADKLPAVTVEAPALKNPVSAPKAAAAKPAPAPVKAAPVKAAPAPAPAAPAAGSAAAAPVAPGGNPYGDPAAAYKVDRSAQTKLTEPILDTPRTITTISKEVIQDKGTTSIRDLARTTPGVTLGTGEGGNPFGDRLFIRGFDARNDAYINGIRDSGAPLRENFNIEQVEILKGPSATIGGRGTSGGAVNVVTKQPGDQDHTKATATLGTDSTIRGSIDANKVYSKELSARVNGMWQEAGVAGRDEVFDNRWGGAVAIAWRPTQSFKLNFDYSHLSLDQLPDWGVPWDTVNARPVTESGVGVRRSNFYGYPARDFQKGEQDHATIGLEAKVNDQMTLSSKMRYGSTVIDYIASAPERLTRVGTDPANWTVTSNPKSRYQETTTVANQTDLTSKFNWLGVDHTFVTGFEFSREGIYRDSYAGLVSELVGTPVSSNGALTLSLLDPNSSAVGFAGSPRLSGNAINLAVNTQSLYALDTIKINPQWIVTLGMRLDNYNLDYTQLTASSGAVSALSRSDLLLNYNAGITYKPLPNGSIYAAYGTSSNPVGNEIDGNGQGYGGISAGAQLLDPEMNTSLEFGTKWELFNRHILATASAFQTDKSNAREAAGQLVVSTGKYRVQGIEVGLGGNITDAFSLYGGAVWMDSEVLESRVAADVGKRFANIAHESFNLLAKYKLTDWMSVGGQVTYRGQINGGTLAALTNHVNEFWRFDASAEFQLSKNFALRLQGINLSDELYYDALYRSGTPFVYVAPGRAGYVTLEAKF